MSGSCGSPAWSAPFLAEADLTLQVQPFPSPLLIHAAIVPVLAMVILCKCGSGLIPSRTTAVSW